MTLDELREKLPELGVAVYAFEPSGVVTLELHTPDGEIYTFKGRTLEEAMNVAFPPPEVPSAPPEPSVANVFD